MMIQEQKEEEVVDEQVERRIHVFNEIIEYYHY